MPGLLSQQQPGLGNLPGSAPGAARPVASAPPTSRVSPDAEVGSEPASPEEQAQYDQFVNKAFEAIYDDQSMPSIIESLKGDGSPVEGLANTAVAIIMRVQDAAEQANQPLSGDVLFNAGIEVVEDLAELAGEAGVADFSPEDIESATYQAMDLYREQKAGAVDAGKDELTRDMVDIVAMDEGGKLDGLAPGMADITGGGAG